MGKFIDLTDEQFDRLKVIGRAENSSAGKVRWECECDCGGKTIAHGTDLRSGRSASCGCLQRERTANATTVHAKNKTRLHQIWVGMKKRTTNEKDGSFHHYGGRGISVCAEWKDDFLEFYRWAMENGYADDLTIDRIENDKGYFPDNCRWATLEIQGRNRRSNRHITIARETKTLTEWAEQYGININTVLARTRLGWDIQSAITTPVRKHK